MDWDCVPSRPTVFLVVVVLRVPGEGARTVGAVVTVVSDEVVCAMATPVIMPSAAAPASRSRVMSSPSGIGPPGECPDTVVNQWGGRALANRVGFYACGAHRTSVGKAEPYNTTAARGGGTAWLAFAMPPP